MKISISALSIAYGLTPEALRYYEEKGLLAPERTPSSGFRRFSIGDMQKLGIIKSLQRQGFSLDEVKHILTKCPQSELIAMMDEKRAELRSQITLSRAIYDRLTTTTDLLRDRDRLLMQPRLCAGAAAYLIDFDSVSALWLSVPKNPLVKDLIDALPMTSYCTIVPLARLTGEDTPIRVGIAAPTEYAAVIKADFSQMRMSAGPRTMRVLFELQPPHKSSLSPVIAAALAFIRENKLTPVSEGYTRQLSWSVDQHGSMCHVSELIIPVM